MASEYFKRMRGEAHRQRTAAVGAPPPPPEPNPWSDAPTNRLSDLGGGGAANDERSAAYADWAQRMQDKRAASKARIAATAAPVAGTHVSGGPTYWSTDALFAESERVAHEELIERPNPWRVNELLALLNLRHDATPHEISEAYKHLAKAHHPDRYAQADEATQQFHADKMLGINKAYRALRQLERV